MCCPTMIFYSEQVKFNWQLESLWQLMVSSLRKKATNHRRLDCLFNRLFRHRSKKTSKLCDTVLCEGKSSVTGEFPAQRTSNAGNVFIWWRHHDTSAMCARSLNHFHAEYLFIRHVFFLSYFDTGVTQAPRGRVGEWLSLTAFFEQRTSGTK